MRMRLPVLVPWTNAMRVNALTTSAQASQATTVVREHLPQLTQPSQLFDVASSFELLLAARPEAYARRTPLASGFICPAPVCNGVLGDD